MLITQDELADSLIEAYNRGIDIDIIIDDEWLYSSGSDYEELLTSGIDIRGDNRANLMHHKVMIIDGYVVVTGSYNWSASAEDSNDENIIILKSSSIAQTYQEEYDRIWSHTALQEPTPTPSPTPTPTATPTPTPKPTPTPTATPTPTPDEEDGKFVGSKKSDVYHRPSCHYVDNIKPENKIWFKSSAEAKAKGYRPCKVCKPP